MMRGATVVLGGIVVLNLGMAVAYYGKALPGYRMGQADVGGKSFAQIANLSQAEVLPDSVQFSAAKGKPNKQQMVPTANLGISANMQASAERLKQQTYWFPLLSVVLRPAAPLVTHIDEARFATTVKGLDQFEQPARPDRVAFSDGSFRIVARSDGFEINQNALQERLSAAIAQRLPRVTVPTRVAEAPEGRAGLSAEVTSLNNQIATKIKYTLPSGAKVQPATAEKGGWYVTAGQTMTLSDENIGKYLDAVGAKHKESLANRHDSIAATRYALTKNTAYDLRLVAQGSPKNTYCIAAKGVSEAGLADLRGKLAATYADVRGWNAGGFLAFEQVSSGCRYTVWLTAPQYMTSFGSICDAYYNCQVGKNVIVNNDRWEKATDPWNAAGRSLEEYRSLIINHETGHRLTFRDHNPTCTQPGQLAPVMMQQSMGLNGCTFNAWPLADELDDFKKILPTLGEADFQGV